MNEKEKGKEIEELKKEIVIERLRQASNISISFGMSDGKFMSRDELINEVKNNTKTGERIIKIQLEYLKAFKKELSQEN